MRAREVLDELEERFGYAFAQANSTVPSLKPRSLARSFASAKRESRFVNQPHGGPTSLGLRFDEGEYSVAYAVDFSDLTDEMASLYEGAGRVDRRLSDAAAAPDPRPSRRRARMGEGSAHRPAVSRSHGQRARLSFAHR